MQVHCAAMKDNNRDLTDRNCRIFEPTIFARRFCEALTLRPAEKSGWVLDLGTGTGTLAFHLRRLGASHVVGVDVDSDALERAARTADGDGVQILFVAGDLLDSLYCRFELIVFNPPVFPEFATRVLSPPLRWSFCGGPTGKELLERAIAGLPKHLTTTGRFAWSMPAFWSDSIGKRLSALGFAMRPLASFKPMRHGYELVLAEYGLDPKLMIASLCDCEDWRRSHNGAPDDWIRGGELEILIAEAQR